MAPCNDTRPCFAKRDSVINKACGCLSETGYRNHQCPFCKPKKEITKGKKYPYNAACCKETHYEKQVTD